MIWILTGLLLVTFSGQPQEILEFKQVEYELSKTLDVYNKCPQPLSSVAYAFAVKETWNGWWLKQANKNNLFWLRRWTSKTLRRPTFAAYENKKYTQAWYNVYRSRHDSIYDFMYQFYHNWCKVTKWYIKWHLNWPKGWNGWVDAYYNTITKLVKKYNSFTIQFRAMIKPKDFKSYHEEITKLENFWFKKKNESLSYSYEKWCTIVIDTILKTYEVKKKK